MKTIKGIFIGEPQYSLSDLGFSIVLPKYIVDNPAHSVIVDAMPTITTHQEFLDTQFEPRDPNHLKLEWKVYSFHKEGIDSDGEWVPELHPSVSYAFKGVVDGDDTIFESSTARIRGTRLAISQGVALMLGCQARKQAYEFLQTCKPVPRFKAPKEIKTLGDIDALQALKAQLL